MRRSICTCNPAYAIAGERTNWEFIYTTAYDLPKGSKINFFLNSSSSSFDWETPSIDVKKKANVIWAVLPNKKNIAAKVKTNQENNSFYEFELPSPIKIGETFTVIMGTPDEKQRDKKGNQCQTYVQRKRQFNVNVYLPGKKEPLDNDIFHLDVKGNKLSNIRIIVPSLLAKNRRFDIVIRFEDKYGNLTNNTKENTLIELSYENLRDNLKWKLFVPETGFTTLPNLYFNEPGIYKIKLNNLTSNEVYYSAPMRCFAETDQSIYWGLLHGESQRYDAVSGIEHCLREARDEKSYDFYSTSSFENEKETTPEEWKKISQQVMDFNEAERFVSFLGQHWLGENKIEGLRQFIFAKDNKPFLQRKDMKSNSLKKIYKNFSPKELISIPCFTIGKESIYNFEDFDPVFERVVEIYNSWGSFESLAKEGNLRPILAGKTENVVPEGSILKALLKNRRFGFVAGGLDDRGVYAKFYDTNQVQYSPGLTAIVAKEQNRDSLIEALYNRSCYATTGAKIILIFTLANSPMGSEIDTAQKPGLLYNRYISCNISASDEIKEVQIIRNGKLFKSLEGQGTDLDFSLDDTDPLEKVVIQPDDKEAHPFVFYYVKIIQKNGHVAWGSPIWIDLKKSAKKQITKK